MGKQVTSAIINLSPFRFDGELLSGDAVQHSTRHLGDLKGIFADIEAFNSMNQECEVYRVASLLPVSEGTKGGLFWGITYLAPGKVGREYFMTKGHFHSNVDTAEFYWCTKGEGMLILMDQARHVWAEQMRPGTLHYIPGAVAHRVANTGNQTLVFAACWPSDAGHDYGTIAEQGFAKRLMDVDGIPQLI